MQHTACCFARLAGHNKFKEKEPRWRDVWTIVKFEKRNLQSNPGKWQMEMRNASAPAGLMLKVLQQRLARHPKNQELQKQLDEEEKASQKVRSLGSWFPLIGIVAMRSSC